MWICRHCTLYDNSLIIVNVIAYHCHYTLSRSYAANADVGGSSPSSRACENRNRQAKKKVDTLSKKHGVRPMSYVSNVVQL